MSINSVKSRQLHRTILMYGFHILVRIFCTSKVKDTQCGFKLFKNESAKRIFRNIHLERWAFDIEVIYLAEKLNYNIIEVRTFFCIHILKSKVINILLFHEHFRYQLIGKK